MEKRAKSGKSSEVKKFKEGLAELATRVSKHAKPASRAAASAVRNAGKMLREDAPAGGGDMSEVMDALTQSSQAVSSVSALAKMYRHDRKRVLRNLGAAAGIVIEFRKRFLLSIVLIFEAIDRLFQVAADLRRVIVRNRVISPSPPRPRQQRLCPAPAPPTYCRQTDGHHTHGPTASRSQNLTKLVTSSRHRSRRLGLGPAL